MLGLAKTRPLAVGIILGATMALPSHYVGSALAQGHPADFDDHFQQQTMRLDYFHSGGMGQEILALDRVVSDGPWAGSLTRLVDHTIY